MLNTTGVIIVFKEVSVNIPRTIIIDKENTFPDITLIPVQWLSTVIVDESSTNLLKCL